MSQSGYYVIITFLLAKGIDPFTFSGVAFTGVAAKPEFQRNV
jgi:hypothetical protein